MNNLAFAVDRTVMIRARPTTVFRYFTDPLRFARWWGEGSSIEGVVGGAVSIRYPDGSRASGVVREIVANERVVFSYGYEGPGKPIAPGASLVTISLEAAPEGTRLRLRHDVATAEVRDLHVQGWRYQLAVFARVVADEEAESAADAVTQWFAAWNETDKAARRETLQAIVLTTVAFRDPNGLTEGVDDLVDHIGGSLQFMPGVRLEQRGSLRHSHGTVLVDFAAVQKDAVLMSGTNVYRFSGGRIAEVIGVPSPRLS
jgi:uncharacterized protein YndB with AHSA1/START domain